VAKQAAEPIDDCRRSDAALLVLIGEQRDELHRLAAEIAEDVATPDRHLEVADRLCRLGRQLGSRAHRLAIRRGAPEL